MSAIRDPRSSIRETRGALPAVPAFIACAFLAISIPPVPDHGYQFYLASRMLDGARLYVDIAAADMHPPLFTWLAAGIEGLGRLVVVSGLTLYPGFVLLSAAGSVYGFWRLTPHSPAVLAALVLILLSLAGPFFGQGEHLALIFSLPYLTAASVDADFRLGRRRRIAIAAAAAIGLAMKPYFALVWLAVELYLVGQRGWRSLLRLESLIIAGWFVIYVALTAILTPEFFRILPWLMELYPKYADVEIANIIIDRRTALLAVGLIAGRFVRTDPWRRLADVLSITALAMFVAVMLQSKGWGYHWYPVSALSVLLCTLALRLPLERTRVLAAAIAVIAAVMMNSQVDRTARLLAGPPTYLPRFIEIVEQHAPGRHVLVLSQLLHPGFPLVNLTRAGWSSPYGHLWMVPAMYTQSWYGRAPVRYRQSGKWQQLEQEMFDRLWQETARTNPALVIIEGRRASGFDLRAYFATDDRFRGLLEQSSLLTKVGPFYVYARPASR